MNTDELIGRSDVLDVLSHSIAGATVRSDALLLVGEAGIGRTACLRAAEAMARAAGHLVLETAGSEAETDLPFAGLHRLLRPVLGLTHTLPDVQRRTLLAALGMQDGGTDDSLVVSIATLNLLRAVADDRAVVITADDVQWLDRQTRHVLGFVARRLDRMPLAIVATTAPVAHLRDLDDAFRELPLDRLDEADAHRLLARRAPALDRPQRRWVVSHAAGNPLALVELAEIAASIDVTRMDPISPVWSMPASLQRAFASQLGGVPKLGRDVVLVAALAADASLSEILAATSLLNGHSVTVDVLDRPQELGLLSVDEARVVFRHPLVKAAILQSESVSRRQSAHRALGAVITVNAYRRAWHRALGAATRDDAIAAELEATTTDSISRGDSAAVITAFERASQLSQAPAERGRRLLLAARHAVRLGQPDVVARLLNLAVSHELSEFDRIRAELLREGVDGVSVAGSKRVVQLCVAARRAADVGERELALELADAAVRRRCAAPVDAAALAELTDLASGLVNTSGGARSIAVFALADPIGHGRAVLAMLAAVDQATTLDGDDLSSYGVAARAVGHYALASQLFDRAEIALRARGLLGPVARNLCVAADLRVELGEWDRAAAALVGFTALSEAAMSVSHRASTMATQAKIAALRGDTTAALELVVALEHSAIARTGSRYLARAQIVRGIAYLSSGRHLDAFDALSRVFDPADPSHHFRERFDAVAYLAEAAAHADRMDQARAIVQGLEPLAAGSGSPALTSHLLYARAALAPDEAAEPLFLGALASDETGSLWQRARTQLAYGRWLRRQLRVTQSRVPLQAALTTFQRLGAERWAAEALDELQASGVHDGHEREGHVVPPPHLLSTQELKIAQLAASGLSNREIGQELYLSPRTVSSHLYRIFPKLGIATRGQIAKRLDEICAVTER